MLCSLLIRLFLAFLFAGSKDIWAIELLRPACR